jgi:hypothetical protein
VKLDDDRLPPMERISSRFDKRFGATVVIPNGG